MEKTRFRAEPVEIASEISKAQKQTLFGANALLWRKKILCVNFSFVMRVVEFCEI